MDIKTKQRDYEQQDAEAMGTEEDDLDLLLSLQDKVLETPPGTPPHTSGSTLSSSTMVIDHFFVSSSSSSPHRFPPW